VRFPYLASGYLLSVGDRPRLLLVITLAEAGGAQTSIANLLPALVSRYDVVVAAHGPGPLVAAVQAAGARYVPLAHVRREIDPWRDVRGLAELLGLCRRERPRIVHANCSKAGLLGIVAAAIARVPVRIYATHGWPFVWSAGPRRRAYEWGDRVIGRLATRIVCVSEAERRAALAAKVCSRARTVVIPNAVDVASAAVARENAGELPIIVSVGRLAAPKDFPTLLRALALLEPGSFRARIVGDGPQRALLEDEARRLGVSTVVEFLGERDDVQALLARSQVFVLATRSEAHPISLLEAMAAGLPVVASQVGGVPEILDGHGFLVPPGDADALAARLRQLVEDPGLRVEHGGRARREAARSFDLPRFHRAYVDLYANELASAGTAGS
jgi:glycosyltransferase involved in cell wall biosynthesis